MDARAAAVATVSMATTIVTVVAAMEKIRGIRPNESPTILQVLHLPSAAPSDDELKKVLRDARTIAVVGLSSSKFRPSCGVSQYMQSAGYRIIPVNPNEREALGEKAYARLDDVPEKIDIVDIFRRSEFVGEIVDAAIRVGARAIWMQEGVSDEAAARRAREAGLFVIMDSCILKEHRRLLR